jgi:L-threonylcarbamoyladenylate synthase
MKIEEAVQIIKVGGIGVIKTDTLYGLVGQALLSGVVERIYLVRRRRPSKPLIVLIEKPEDVRLFGIDTNSADFELAKKQWPGKISIILPCDQPKFEYLHRGTKTLAFRVPDNEELRNILKETGPLVAPSVNHEGEIPAFTIPEAKVYFGNEIDFYVDVGEVVTESSTLVKITNGKFEVLREGAVKIKVD